MPLPPEAAAFFEAVSGHGRGTASRSCGSTRRSCPDVGEHNLFELIVRRDQHAYLGTDLVDAFCGVFDIGSLGNGDTYHLELYEWDGPRQVLHFDHETHAFSKVFADSLDSLVYLAALAKAGDEHKISRSAYRTDLRKLHGKVAPTWHFEIEDKDRRLRALRAEAARQRVLLLSLALDHRAAQERRRHRHRAICRTCSWPTSTRSSSRDQLPGAARGVREVHPDRALLDVARVPASTSRSSSGTSRSAALTARASCATPRS